MDDDIVEIIGVNPYPPGSDAWHKHNLGLDQDSIGQMESVESDEDGVRMEFWYYGPSPVTKLEFLSIGLNMDMNKSTTYNTAVDEVRNDER